MPTRSIRSSALSSGVSSAIRSIDGKGYDARCCRHRNAESPGTNAQPVGACVEPVRAQSNAISTRSPFHLRRLATPAPRTGRSQWSGPRTLVAQKSVRATNCFVSQGGRRSEGPHDVMSSMMAVMIPPIPHLGGLRCSQLTWGISSHGLEKTRIVRGKKARCFMGVVRTAAQFDILHRRRAADCEWHHVMELQEPTFGASAVGTDESALTAVAVPHFPPHSCGMCRLSHRPGRRARRGVVVAANFLRSSSASSTVSARSKIVAGSPFGTTCRIRSWTCRSLSRVSRLIVNWTLNRSGASGVTAGPGGVDSRGYGVGTGVPLSIDLTMHSGFGDCRRLGSRKLADH